MKQISGICGVSEATVSKALRNIPGVKTGTRQRILEVAEQFNYRPNALIRTIQAGKSMVIGIACNVFNDMFAGTVMQGIMQALQRRNYQAFVMSWDNGVEQNIDMIRIFSEHRVDGIIVFPPCFTAPVHYLNELNSFYGPVVAVDQEWPGGNIDCVCSDDVQGGKLATETAILKGHQDIACFYAGEISTGQKRLEGFREAMAIHELPVRKSWLIDTGGSKDKAYQAASELLKDEKHPSAVVCFNDLIACRVIAAAIDLGYTVPDDLSVIGYANLELGAEMRPALTTICQDTLNIGTKAVELLMNRLGEKNDHPHQTISLPVKLIERQSVAPPQTLSLENFDEKTV